MLSPPLLLRKTCTHALITFFTKSSSKYTFPLISHFTHLLSVNTSDGVTWCLHPSQNSAFALSLTASFNSAFVNCFSRPQVNANFNLPRRIWFSVTTLLSVASAVVSILSFCTNGQYLFFANIRYTKNLLILTCRGTLVTLCMYRYSFALLRRCV